MREYKKFGFLAAFLSSTALGCAADDSAVEDSELAVKGGAERSEAKNSAVTNDFVEALLPEINVIAECERVEPAELCDWAGSVDAVFRARVVEVVPSRTDYVQLIKGETNSGPIVSTCEGGRMSHAALLRLDNEENLHGDAPLGSIEVRVGSGQTGVWLEVWSNSEGLQESEDGTLPLAPGTVIGVAATRVKDGSVWSTVAAPIFTFTTEGKIKSSKTTDCSQSEQMPRDSEGMAYSELKSALSGCADQSSLKEERLGFSTLDPRNSYASVCRSP